MKHIFLVHSPVTFLVSVSVINELKISAEDAIIIFERFEKISGEQYVCADLNEGFDKKFSIKKIVDYFRHFSMVKRIDLLANKLTDKQKFVAYIAALTYSSKSLITHAGCVSFNFIEEGLTNYYKEETLHSLNPVYSKYSWRTSVLKQPKTVLNEIYWLLRGYNFKLLGLPFSYSSYNFINNVVFYGLSNDSFPLINEQKKTIVPFNKNNFQSIKLNYNINLDNKFIWIGDAGVKMHGFSESLYLNGIKEGCINFLKQNGVQNILIKFHRDEAQDLRQAVQNLYNKNNISYEVIPDSVIMELLLFEAKNVTLIGVYSSLLYYASIMGHHSFSIYNFLKKEYSKVLKNRDFNFYWNRVKLIEHQDTKFVGENV